MKSNIELQLKEALQQEYRNSDTFLDEIIFPVFGEENYESAGNLNVLRKRPDLQAKANLSGILDIRQVGGLYVEGSQLDIFDVTLDYKKQLRSNRVEIQQIIRSIMGTHSGAFIIFHYHSGARWEWRFTFCHKGASQVDSTDAKRYTFLLGPGQSCRTAAENFMKIHTKIEHEGEFEMDDIIKAFDVESLSREFFDKYKAQYEKFCKYVYDNRTNPSLFGEFFATCEEKIIRDYVKKMLGRLVFLQFLQKKGWLGGTSCQWNDGDPNFLQNLYKNATPEQKENFLDDVLEPLFHNALDGNRAATNQDFDTQVEGFRCCKIPYLNGGLFSKDAQIDDATSVFPGAYFEDLLTFFSQYNFTIDENDPNDAAVGIDPEMLGRIFENLLEDNKDKGAFYTPKEIVQYMCRESLIAYLQTDLTEEAIKESIRQFVMTYDAELLAEELQSQIDQKLKDVKICDPAIGSGAFPMGLLRELFACRMALKQNFSDEICGNLHAEIKKEIIQNNIYGVDIEKGAVDIARLRFWLTLILDEEDPKALPNLDFKIVQGNSLLESYHGLDLAVLTNVEKKSTSKGLKVNAKTLQSKLFFIDEQEALKSIQRNIRQYYSTQDHSARQLLLVNIENGVRQYLLHRTEGRPDLQAEIVNLPLFNDKFFLWHTFFADVFENGGFDIVIGNPPYIKEDFNSSAFIGFKETSPYYMGKMDLWYGFACHGIDLLRSNGIIALIAQNNWTTSAGAKKMRNKIAQDAIILQMLDFNEYMVFEGSASIQTMIMLFQKNANVDNFRIDVRRLLKGASKTDMIGSLQKQIGCRCEYLKPTFVRANKIDSYFTFSVQDDLLDKIAEQPCRFTDKEATNGIHPHYDFVNKKIHTNHPEVRIGEGIFGLSSEEKENLQLTKDEDKLIKPYYTSEQVKRYYTIDRNTQWIIYTGSEFKNSESMNPYPNLKKHLDKYDGIISSDNKPYGLHRARQESFFKSEKIAVLRKCVGKPSFSYSDFDCYLSATFYVLKTNRWNMKFLTGVLNSKLIAFWLKHRGKMQGENYQLDKEPLLNIPLPLETCEQQSIITFVDYILTAKNANPQADITEFEQQIDHIVYQLYGLTEEEIAIIESSVQN